jgi:hypothetical protein
LLFQGHVHRFTFWGTWRYGCGSQCWCNGVLEVLQHWWLHQLY